MKPAQPTTEPPQQILTSPPKHLNSAIPPPIASLSNSTLPRHSDASFETDDMSRSRRQQAVLLAAQHLSRQPCSICFESLTPAQLVPFNYTPPPLPSDSSSRFFHESPPVPSAPVPSAGCQHQQCRACIRAYLEHEITEGKVMRIRCPGLQDEATSTSSSKSASPSAAVPSKACACIASSDFIKRYVSPETWRKYQRFLKLKLNQSYRSCPNRECLHVQQFIDPSLVKSAPPSTGKVTATPPAPAATESMMIECERCAQIYCFRHDLAHPPQTPCAVYEKQQAVENADSVKLIEKSSVKCPNEQCGVRTTRSTGCNHMTCSRCRTEYCYLCGAPYKHGMHSYPHRCTETAHYREFGVHLQDPVVRFANGFNQPLLQRTGHVLGTIIQFSLLVLLWLVSAPLFLLWVLSFFAITAGWYLAAAVSWALCVGCMVPLYAFALGWLHCGGKRGKWWWRRKVSDIHRALHHHPLSSSTFSVRQWSGSVWSESVHPRLRQLIRGRQVLGVRPEFRPGYAENLGLRQQQQYQRVHAYVG